MRGSEPSACGREGYVTHVGGVSRRSASVNLTAAPTTDATGSSARGNSAGGKAATQIGTESGQAAARGAPTTTDAVAAARKGRRTVEEVRPSRKKAAPRHPPMSTRQSVPTPTTPTDVRAEAEREELETRRRRVEAGSYQDEL
jgi:hypothetical protein